MEYIVLNSDDLNALAEVVNHYIKQGWQPLGGVACALSESDEYKYTLFCQAMTRQLKGIFPAGRGAVMSMPRGDQ